MRKGICKIADFGTAMQSNKLLKNTDKMAVGTKSTAAP